MVSKEENISIKQNIEILKCLTLETYKICKAKFENVHKSYETCIASSYIFLKLINVIIINILNDSVKYYSVKEK